MEMVEITGPERGARAAPRTFLLTDIEGSTRLWQESPEAMETALGQHDAAFAAGRALPLAAAIEYALSDDPPTET
ncbi:MAG: hypothetical protein ACREJQ_04655 [bacterium]